MRLWRFALAYLLAALSFALIALAVHWHSTGWAVWFTAQVLAFLIIALAEVQRAARRR